MRNPVGQNTRAKHFILDGMNERSNFCDALYLRLTIFGLKLTDNLIWWTYITLASLDYTPPFEQDVNTRRV